jgi:hypothetical protein
MINKLLYKNEYILVREFSKVARYYI